MTLSLQGSHDHQHCIRSALQSAHEICQQRGVRLTELRRNVLEFIWQNHRPISAYDILPQLAECGFNSSPPTVYRALDFLLECGLIHRISSLNAYIGCSYPHQEHAIGFFVCQQCGIAEELSPSLMDTLDQQLSTSLDQQLGAEVKQHTMEVTGICRQCQ